MPYEWTSSPTSATPARLDLWPHRSLPKRGFAGFMMVTCIFLTFPLIPLLGTVVLWGLLPFLIAAVAGMWWALSHSYDTGRMHEALIIDSDAVHLTRTNPKGEVLEWGCNSYWAQVDMHPTGGPVAHYLTLKGSGRVVEIGAFLSEDERKVLYSEISGALRVARSVEQ
ncbi:DUF2244 domain-containing protein [Roseovarius sp. LXJ103]|uniref:DUF2244 domain-containing protein n=1 Tax=Roseovarius carneus TaxID=2853164 RepID=UPI000D609CBE|nr:DUF2244 domain-containing protein [Roseovarius carneus]MBZ8118209.1 DUF2244 domain-containing protein [Roseovarius carneus]PWE37306.1 DUF2244 domain-containing protein [Pelagicola sp. LXJ1103]